MNKKMLLLGALLLAAASVAACGSDESDPADPGPGPGPGPTPGGCTLVGLWTIGGTGGPTIDIRSNGTTHLVFPGGAGSQDGTWSQSGSTMSITDQTCGSAVGTYTFAFSNACNTLTVHLGSDPCASRARGIDGSVLTR